MVELPYSREVIKHFKNPKNLGRMKNPDAVGEAGNLLCVSPQTVVWTNNKLTPIANVKPGDFVLSHNGNYEIVTKTHKRNHKGKLVRIRNRLGSAIVTPDHLVLAIKVPKTEYFLHAKNKKKLPVAWYHAEDLEEGDMIVYPILKGERDLEKIHLKVKKFKYDFRDRALPSFVKLDDKFLRLAGYFLAKGYASTKITRSFLTFTLNTKKEEIIKDVKDIVKELFNLNAKIKKGWERNTTVIFVYSSILSRFFKRLFGESAENKSIPHFMMLLPKEKQKHLIYGIWRGDGYVNLKRDDPRAGYLTISYQLAQQLKLLLLRQGVVVSLYEEKEKIRKGVHHKTSYRIHIGDKISLTKLSQILGINWDSNKRIQKKSWIENGCLYTPITKIELINYNGLVRNLEVKNSKSFISDCVVLHNCGDVMRIYLKVRESKDEKIISDIKGEVFGCIVAVANTSLLTTMVKGKTLEEAMKINKDELIKKLGGRGKIPPIKIHCSILALDALYEAIYNYYKKKKLKIPEFLENEHRRIQDISKIIEERHKEYIELEKKVLGRW